MNNTIMGVITMTNSKRKTLPLGTFEVKSDCLMIADPCYIYGDVCVKNVKKGVWKAKVIKSDEGYWGIRCAELIAIHESISDVQEWMWEKQDFYISVDSGQAGIYDIATFRKDDVISTTPNFSYMEDEEGEKWYAANCDITLSEESAGVLTGGVVSSTGYGDGLYDCYLFQRDEEVLGVRLVFINDEEMDQEEMDCICEDEE
jgi:hypothetical protein